MFCNLRHQAQMILKISLEESCLLFGDTLLFCMYCKSKANSAKKGRSNKTCKRFYFFPESLNGSVEDCITVSMIIIYLQCFKLDSFTQTLNMYGNSQMGNISNHLFQLFFYK